MDGPLHRTALLGATDSRNGPAVTALASFGDRSQPQKDTKPSREKKPRVVKAPLSVIFKRLPC